VPKRKRAVINERHYRRMAKLVELDDGKPPPGFEEIYTWLGANVPVGFGASIVHNDYPLGHVIIGPDRPHRSGAGLGTGDDR
jgi:aminoglycoside phosphotransferase (APT) family kinase protein